MNTKKQRQMIQIVAATFIFCILGGCTDNPDDKNTKAQQKQTSEALNTFAQKRDIQTSKEQVEKAISLGRKGGLTADAALFTSANFELAEAQRSFASLMLDLSVVNTDILLVNQSLEQLWDISMETSGVQRLLALSDNEIVDLQNWIGLSDNPNSINGKIDIVSKELAQLQDKKSAIEKEYNQARNTMLDIQSQADTALRQAETADSSQKGTMENAAFDLMARKKEYYLKAQEAENLLAQVDSQLSIVEPHLNRLKESLKQSETKLLEVKNSANRDVLTKQISVLAAQVQQGKTILTQKLNQLNASLSERNKRFDELLKTIEAISDKYQKINSRQLEPNLSLSQGQTFSLGGNILSTRFLEASTTTVRMEGLIRTYQDIIPPDINEIVILNTTPDQELAKKAISFFDLSAQAYEKASSMSSQLGSNSKQAACAALKGQMLAVNSKMRLLDAISDFESAEKAQAELEAMKEKAKEYGALFSQSTTALLLNKGLDFTPVLPVDTTMIMEGVRKEFAEWRRLRGPAQQAEVEKLAVRIQQLSQEYPDDEQMKPFLDQEQQAMDEARAKGFAEESNDPNQAAG